MFENYREMEDMLKVSFRERTDDKGIEAANLTQKNQIKQGVHS